jgi:hypothetical protein
VLSSMPGTPETFFLWIVGLRVARRRAGAAGACFAQSKMYAPNMMALPRRRETRAQGQRAGRIVRPPSSRFFAKLSAAGCTSVQLAIHEQREVNLPIVHRHPDARKQTQ